MMSRRQRTTLQLSIRIPLPPKTTQKAAIEIIREHLKELGKPGYGGFLVHEMVVKLEGKETVYLSTNATSRANLLI
jgi:hypothetical protein